MLLILVGLIVSCSQAPEKMIIGTWKITDIKTNENLTPKEKEIMDETKATSSFKFNEDKTLESKFGTDPSIGKWSISADGKTLTIEERRKANKSIIKQLSSSKFIFEQEQNGVITTVTLEKQ